VIPVVTPVANTQSAIPAPAATDPSLIPPTLPSAATQPPTASTTKKPTRYLEHKPEYFTPDPVYPTQQELNSQAAEATSAVRSTPPSIGVGPALQVCLKLGDSHPKFEVCRGDDVLLKVVCTGVDVKAPSEKGQPFSVLRASGTVRFSAPGCEGTCEELVVHPVTGDVILTKGVEVRCKLGKGTTVMKSEQMTFKLGTAPAFAVAGPGEIVTTSGQK
jgi:hypothetical protein